MTIGKLYYLASVLDGLDRILWVVNTITGFMLAGLVIITVVMLTDYTFDDDFFTPLKKYLKITCLVFLGTSLLNVFMPSKEDFLIIALTKDYRPEQVYKMTKDELKSGVDYVIEKLKEMEK